VGRGKKGSSRERLALDKSESDCRRGRGRQQERSWDHFLAPPSSSRRGCDHEVSAREEQLGPDEPPPPPTELMLRESITGVFERERSRRE